MSDAINADDIPVVDEFEDAMTDEPGPPAVHVSDDITEDSTDVALPEAEPITTLLFTLDTDPVAPDDA
jgi:hypothetical protein